MAATGVKLIRKVRIAVVGSGVSGLQAASALIAQNIPASDIVVLEADSIIGGRVRQATDFIPGMELELGAEFVHGGTTLIHRLAKEHDWRLDSVFTWAHGDGGPSETPVHGAAGYYYLGKEKKVMRFDGVDRDMDQLHNTLWEICEMSYEETLATRRNDSLEDLLKERLPPAVASRVLTMADAGYANTVGAPGCRFVSLSELVRFERDWTARDGDGDGRLYPSFRILVEKLAEPVTDVLKSWKVSRVDARPSQDHVVITNEDRGEAVEAEVVIMAVPLTILQAGDIAFDPPLSAERQASLHRIGVERGVKVLLRFDGCRPAPWPLDAQGVISSDSPVPEFWFRRNFGGSHLAVGFLLGKYAEAAVAAGPEAFCRTALGQLSDMFGMNPAATYQAGRVFDWGSVPSIRGAYSYPRPGCTADDYALISSPHGDGRIHFAGEHTSYPGSAMTVHAAMETGLRAARETLSHLGLLEEASQVPMPSKAAAVPRSRVISKARSWRSKL